MYSSRGNNSFGQQPYSSQSSYAPQNLGAASLLAGRSQESEFGGLRAHGHVHGHPSSAAAVAASPQPHYSGQYNSAYGSSAQQISPMGKGSVATALEGRSNYGSSIPVSPKFSADYVSSSRGYGQKVVDQLYSDRISEYPSIERRQYAERHSAYLGTDLPNETVGRYAQPVSFGHEHQSKMYDHMEQVLKARGLQSASVEGGPRQADYLVGRATVGHPVQDPITYGGRNDPESRTLSMITGSSYGGQQGASILGAAPHRTVDDLVYAQSSSNPGYGVSLPPGRDYGAGKGLHRTPLESDFPITALGRTSHLRVEDRKDDRFTYGRDLERREKDRDFLREREKDREREKERLRERDRERERERDRQREREREREREQRERERERRDKEKGRDHKRGLELRRELTPPRTSRDRRGPSITKDSRSQQRESPRREVSNRPHSPIKEKRREYSCKVFSFTYVEAERDFLSLDKRYPRLYISPECSKVLVHWPKQSLKLPFYTPVSFEHDFIEDECVVEVKGSPSSQLITDVPKGLPSIWNAKVILMSGLSQNAQTELSSERSYDDRIPHFCNLLRFAIMKKNSSLMAIGGPWDAVDGGDPSVDDSCLIRTAVRYAKDATNLDLSNCQRWNRFLEIHYHRVGKDGRFSHNEVTVLYVPDLSDCLPSLDLWRDQWINHKKLVAERERQQMKKEKLGHKDEVAKDKKKVEPGKGGTAKGEPKGKTTKVEPVKGGASKVEQQKKKDSSSSGHVGDDVKKVNDAHKLKGEDNLVSQEGNDKDKPVETKNVVGSVEEEKSIEKKDQVESSSAQEAAVAKPGKKKIIKRIVKKKVAAKKDAMEEAVKPSDALDKDDAAGKNIASEVDGQKDDSSSNPPVMKTFTRKKIVKKPVQKAEQATPEVKEPESAEEKEKINLAEATDEVVKESVNKTTVKKKVVKRVPKRKAVALDTNNKVAEDDTTKNIIPPEQIKVDGNGENQKNENILKDNKSPKIKAQNISVEKQDKKEGEKGNIKDVSGSVKETSSLNHKVSQTDNVTGTNEKKELNGEKVRTNNDEKNESKAKTNKLVKEKRKSDEPPRHPGFIIQTKTKKDTKLQSVSLSLDSLLDYSNKDLEESNFELSIFAESLYEMLQYEMGCRLLAFLQRLRVKFISKKIQGKRLRPEPTKKDNESSSQKRAKIKEDSDDIKSVKIEKIEDGDDIKSVKTENKDDSIHHDNNDINNVTVEGNDTKPVEDAKVEDINDEEDPEEDPEEDEEMQDADHNHDSAKEEIMKTEKIEGEAGDVEQSKKLETQEQAEEANTNPEPSSNDLVKAESESKGTSVALDKELLQAFRFFDRNRVGYIRVEDMRLIIHNLGKFLPHREVKELVQSALLESNTGRDDRILYEKLMKISVN